MTRRWSLMLVLLLACKHDADELRPSSKKDVATWLGLEQDSPCPACLATRCETSADACLRDALCRLTMEECSPPNPGCAPRTVQTRDMAHCILDACKGECGIPAYARQCIGAYEWLLPERTTEIPFEIRLRQFQGVPWPGTARVVPCSGPTPMCEDARAVEVKEEGTVAATYNYTVTRTRPYFRVTGEGLRTMLFYEDAVISEGTQLNIPALSESVLQGLAGLLGTSLDPTRGILDATLFDCNGDPMGDARLVVKRAGQVLEGVGVPYYFSADLPRPVSEQPRTSVEKGQAGVVNLEPGLYDLNATVNDVTVSRIESVLVEPGIVTHVNMMPRSRDELP